MVIINMCISFNLNIFKFKMYFIGFLSFVLVLFIYLCICLI